ncbi:MAG: ACP synthase [Candidatus Cloacimonadota bacterium]|nr:MAG: ACP synthase [Candidatus Cloacimonadota bacterium]
MIFGTGCDLIEVERIRKAMERNPGFKQKIFTGKEINYCEQRKSGYQSYAARFAAKEAFFKAIGTGIRDKLKFTDAEILNNENGKPVMNITGHSKEILTENNITKVHVSLSHLKSTAMATVILEKNGG